MGSGIEVKHFCWPMDQLGNALVMFSLPRTHGDDYGSPDKGPSASALNRLAWGERVTGPHQSAHQTLRHAMGPWHDRVEAAFAVFDLATEAGLIAFLLAQAAAVLPLERALDAGLAESLLPDWRDRRRSDALLADLHALEVSVPSPLPIPDISTGSLTFGVLYVLEGSRLGGKILARLVTAADHRRMRVSSFLSHDAGPGQWRHFLSVLDNASLNSAELQQGASLAFALFEQSAREVHASAGAR